MLSLIFKSYFSVIKTFYPFFLSSNYTPLDYSPYYLRESKKLQIDKANIHQVSYEYLNKFLITQISDDKRLFIKDKEILFVGRSNTGKSSLINKIFEYHGKKKIARTAKRPGTTKFLHFHRIKNSNCLIVDAPGYGFANMNKRRRQMWFGLMEEYMKISSRLSQIVLCVNFQHGLKNSDKLFLQRAERFNVNIQVIMTKSDKISKVDYFVQLQSIVEEIKRLQLKNVNERMLVCSTKTDFGIQFVKMRIVEVIQNSLQRNIDQKEDLLLDYLKEMRVQPIELEKKQKTLSKQYLVRKLVYNSKLSKYLM